MNCMEITETLPNTMAEEVPKMVRPAADLLQNIGDSHPACLMDAQTQNTDCTDEAVRGDDDDDDGKATALGKDTERQSVNNNVGVTASCQTPPIVESKEEKTLYHSVLRQMQQQQKLKGGRRCKKKTLMKMAKLFVIAKEWDSDMIETSEVKYSNGPLSEHGVSVLNQREEAPTSSITSQKKTFKTKSPNVGRSACNEETFLPAFSAESTSSAQPAAPQVTLKEKRRTPSTRKNQAEKDCSASTHLHDVPDLNLEVSADSKLITTPKQQKKSRKISSVTFKEDTKIICDNSEIAGSGPAMISSVDVSKTKTSKQRKKSPTISVKKRSKQKVLPQTLTDYNAVMQEVREDFLVSYVSQKNEKVLCTTAAEIHIKDPPGTKSKGKAGRTPRKKAVMTKPKPFIQEVETPDDSKKSDTSKVDILSYQQPSLSQVLSRGKKKKKEVIPCAPKRRSTEKQHSKLKSDEVMAVTPESIIKTEEAAGIPPNDEVLFQVEHQDCSVQDMEVKTRHPNTLQKVEKKIIRTSKPRCKKGQQAVQLQKQNKTAPVRETTNISNSQLQNPRKRAANNKKCKAEPVIVPVSVSFSDHSAMNQCVAAESLMQVSDIKTEPDCEPPTQPLTKITTSKKSRQQKRPPQKAKNTITLNAPIKEERDYFDIQGGTFSQKICGSEEKLPCGAEINNKAQKDVENSGSSITGKALDTAHKSVKQMGRRKTVILEPDDTSLENLQRNETKCKKLKQRKVTSTSLGVNGLMEVTAQHKESLISYLKHMKSSQVSKCRRRRSVKKEPVVDEAVVKNSNILDEVLPNPPNEKPHDVNITGNQEETPNVPKEEELISDRIKAANPENMKKFKAKKKRLVGRRCLKVAALVEENVKMTGDVQSVENGLTSPSLPENVPENVKAKRKREGQRSLGGQAKQSLEITETGPSEKSVTTCAKKSLRGNQRVSHKHKKKSSAAMLSEDTSKGKDLKNALTVSFEAPKSDMTWGENVKTKVATKHRFGQKAKKKVLMDLPNQDPCEQQPESDTGVLVNHEICNKPKTRCKSGKRKAPTRSDKAPKAVKLEDAVSSINDVADMDLNVVKQEHHESKISEAASTFQDKIGLIESAVSAGSTIMTTIRKRRKNKTVWYPKKKLKRTQSRASFDPSTRPVSVHPCNSLTDDELINLKVKDENDYVTQRNIVQPPSSDQAEEMTANAKVEHSSELKNCDPIPQKLKPQKPLKCSFCGRSFRHISAFTVHKRIHTGEKPYRCTTCSKRFAHISQLNQHSKFHTESPAVCCPCCDQKCKSKDELIVHFFTHVKDGKSSNVTEDAHNQQEVDCLDSPVTSSHNKPFRCSVCCNEFISRAMFKMHRRTHDGKPHTCSVCGKKFRKPSSLSLHEKTHWPVKPYSCSVCCKGFVKLQELKRHSEMHSGVAPFSCARCEKAFESFALLRSHQMSEVCSEKEESTEGNQVDIEGFLVSQGVKGQIVTPVFFKCPICKQLHRHWCQHILHLGTHSESKSYTCETCGQEYKLASDLRSHCTVCCRVSGEERVCRSSMCEIWKEPEALQSQTSEASDEDQKGQTSFSPQEKAGEKEFMEMQSPTSSPSNSSPSVNNDFDIGVPAPDPVGEFSVAGNDQTTQKPSRFHLIQRYCGRYSCGRCGKTFKSWNKLWLHQRSHRQTVRPFCCSQCDLEFRFLGSYIDHLQEHAAQMPYICPLCPDTFSSGENLSAHIFECHKQDDSMKCSTCGKSFTTLRHLKKHKLLHKGASSHFCLPCNVSFSHISALRTHLKTHKTCLKVPQPAGLVEPLLFPYQCRKCTSKFSSTDLLQAHQVCHFTAGEKQESPSENVTSCIPSRAPQDTQQGGVSSQCKRLPVSNKKHLFRYPHPDRLYVVPVISSEPPVVISDTEEEQQQFQSPSITTPTSNTTSSSFPQGQPAPDISNIPQSSSDPIIRDMDKHLTGSSHQQPQDYSLIPPILQDLHHYQDAWKHLSDTSDCDSDSAELESPFMIFKENESVDDTHYCTICTETFTDISKLHEHYIDHTRGM
ncbi:uncharacterized protein LOC121913799 [Scomber scombrus]